MPSYITHAIMGEQLHQELTKNNIYKIPITEAELRSYSLGIDLSYLSKHTKKDPHNYRTKDFFLTMIKYIKDNNLIENSHIISLLYGHISHYFLDTNIHPLIYYLEYGCKQVGPISTHNLLEGYLSSYLSKKILNKEIIEIKPSYFNQINLLKEESTLLNQLYGYLYDDYTITQTYKKTIYLFTLLEKVIKSTQITKENLIQLTKFNIFLEQNNLTSSEILNNCNNTYTNPVSGIKHKESFLELYNKSIEMTYNAILAVNNYLYSNTHISNLENIFKNLSYDTGLDCKYKKIMKYVRKR